MTKNLKHERKHVSVIELKDNSKTKVRDNYLTCSSCGKFKKHRGHGMCCACTRDYKRKTKPSFWLGTCYSEMKRRTSTFDPKRPNYHNMELCSKEEFMDRFVEDETFLRLFKEWQEHDYKRGFAPSIDRIDNKMGYLIPNMQFIRHSENGKKDWVHKVRCIETGMIFESQLLAAKFYEISTAQMSHILNGKASIPGVTLERVDA